ncbi:DotU family type VI secretion system protein [Enterobacillus tribolii]|uniref:Type VI secretion system protein ImpK n=1 Tax=Enterobacillus tribolii TaxID=1487935 RepID=A0A370QS57_9GAMM|nr:DotU family type VI secretion system protein [Enterobacillus tribolii]MBW7983728.1 DotU family type VI secretion system protein [Enterobacillus tribolii]RDK92092.1 type VI secretion system protein ImpK [Enterobacillus tribolii]
MQNTLTKTISEPLLAPTEAVKASDNPLVMAANPLLNMIPAIRSLATRPDPAQLRQTLIDDVRRFEVRGQQEGLPYDVLVGARYCLCTALDEAAMLTPWGKNTVWSASGLLVTFHNETWGGEKFFQLLARLSKQPRKNILLLELINYCLLLGFEGRYHIIENGFSQLETLRQRLSQIIHSVRGAYPAPLSGYPTDVPVSQKKWRPMLPLWACAAFLGLLSCLWYISLDWKLGEATTPVVAAIYQLELPTVRAVEVPAPPVPSIVSLKTFLEPEIRDGLLTVRDEDQKSIVILRGDGLFDSASTTVRDVYRPVLVRVAEALNDIDGKVMVTGYTDSDAIRKARFASNYDLSLARAESVSNLLQKHLVQPSRIQIEGKGEQDPIAPNNSRANKALNRRVEITLHLAPGVVQPTINPVRAGGL